MSNRTRNEPRARAQFKECVRVQWCVTQLCASGVPQSGGQAGTLALCAVGSKGTLPENESQGKGCCQHCVLLAPGLQRSDLRTF